MERDIALRSSTESEVISTHTLTWSVTVLKGVQYIIIVISTHTLTWSVTQHGRGDSTAQGISTHTLTWSVTTNSDILRFVNPFQLTRSRGA